MARSPLIPDTPTADDYAQDERGPLEDMFTRTDPLSLFADWFAEARVSEPSDPNAMSLASVDADGRPDVRIVLLKDFGPQGFVFYSHADSAKGRQLARNGEAALGFHWKSLERQVRLRGAVQPVSGAAADAYFASRARLSQIGAWASEQSRPLESREALRAKVREMDAAFGEDVPRPEGWQGFAVRPRTIEFWRAGAYRLHDRLLFTRDGEGWTRQRLYP